ncbi:MAG TPA: YlmC/YmxH family sporulation protein [Firmicutes bacterium]|jgi:YlmC/YmxH family sporulation protein|nr:YlmC/YmxH family sporulation protein [Bacillota bacterium]HBR29794.1 YlmC/YmxH family sporulation protein [Bacillota bacterium]HBR33405.1 YlmC/YmxH family sporulation protein [Bacillota bacterium]
MRWSELSRKELVNLVDGSKSGPFLKLDLLINMDTGNVVTLLLPGRGYISRQEQEIPWAAVKKISTDLILYEEVGHGKG